MIVPKTVRVDSELWDKFKKVAKYKNSDASKEVRKFIERYLAENSQLFLEIESRKERK